MQIVAVVGRPNVGKSTLFNRIVGGRKAIVEDSPGVTRDRLYKEAEWLNRRFMLIDTGGFQWQTDDIYRQVKKQAEIAIEEADVIIFVVDNQTGLTIDDQDVAAILRKTGKPVILAVNKVDNFDNVEMELYQFYALGLGDPIPISSTHGMNIGDLLDAVVELFPSEPEEDENADVPRIAVVGRPNVGKSSLVNFLTGKERVIVSNIAGTTRDAIDTKIKANGKEYVLVDTAGLRRRSKVEENLEYYSVMRALSSIDRADVVFMMLDAVDGVTDQDKKIAGYVHEAGKPSIIVINKWDLVEKDTKTMKAFEEHVREKLGFVQYAPMLFISVETGQRVTKLLELADHVMEQAEIRIPTSTLNEFIAEVLSYNPPPTDKGKQLKIKYCTQAGIKPPSFVMFVNNVDLMHFSYKRHIENQLRKVFGFVGNPIVIIVKQNEKE
ncbi:MAG: ribosome biogenesis GTPase Der [Clostridia bacterium]